MARRTRSYGIASQETSGGKKDGVLIGAEFGARTDEAKALLKDFIFEMATGTAF